jgi:DNA gyrase/topoisomerase IV subunit B
LSLSKKCSNCKYNSLTKYKLVNLLVLDFLKINAKIERLEKLEEEAKQAKEAVIAALQAAYAKQSYLNKQKKFLKCYK